MTASATFTLDAIDNTKTVLDGAAGALSGLGDVAGGILTAGLAAATAAFAGLATGAGFALSAAMDNEKAQAELAQVLKSTGGAAGLTQDAANALAQEFMNLAGGSDDAILAIETIGLRAGTISADEMPAFIQSVLDLGTVMGDTSTAATLLARAQEDPIAAFKRIEKSTGAYNTELEDQIKALQDAGDNAGAVDLIMQQLATTTGGAAAAQAETLAGQWEIVQGRLGEAAETIGTALLPIAKTFFEDVIAPAIPMIEQLAEGLGVAIGVLASGEEDIQGSFDAFAEFANDVLPGSADIIRGVGEALQGFVDSVVASLPAAQAAIQPVIDAAGNLVSAFVASMPMIQGAVQGMVDFVIGQFNALSPTIIANVSSMLNSVAEFWTAHGTQIMATVTLVWDVIVTTIGTALTAASGLVAAGLELINGDTAGALDILQTTFTTIMDNILSLVGTDLDTFVSDWSGTFSMVDDVVNIGIAAVGNSILDGLNAAITGAQTTLQGFADVGQGIIDGIVSAIQSGAANVVNAMLGMLQDAIDAAQHALGIQSPSKVFAQMGKQTMAGMAMGIADNAHMPKLALGEATRQIVNHYNLTVNTPAPYNVSSGFGRMVALNGAW